MSAIAWLPQILSYSLIHMSAIALPQIFSYLSIKNRLVTPNIQLLADKHVSHRLVTPKIQ